MEKLPLPSASAEGHELRNAYVARRCIFIPGKQVRRLAVALGANLSDLVALSAVGDRLPPDPTLPFRRSRNGRFCFDTCEQSIWRLERQPFVLSAAEDFVRHDSGQLRMFEELEGDIQYNSVFRALLMLKYLLIDGVMTAPRRYLDYSSCLSVCTVFHLRTVTMPELLGEPALEGVHSDGVDHTMTTLVGSSNMHPGSAKTFLHDNSELSGQRWDEANPTRVLGRFQHRELLDTLLIADHEQKHSVSPVFALDRGSAATRDMLVFFTRKPAVNGHISYSYDSLVEHPRLSESLRVRPL